jgi:DNA-binding transcriptional MocR family regulator
LFRHINGINLFEAILTDTAVVVHCNLSAKDVERATYPGFVLLVRGSARACRLQLARRHGPEKLGGLPSGAPQRPATTLPTPNVYEVRRRGRRSRSPMPSSRSSSPNLLALRETEKQRANPPPPRRPARKKGSHQAAGGHSKAPASPPRRRQDAGRREKARRTDEARQLIRTFHRPFRRSRDKSRRCVARSRHGAREERRGHGRVPPHSPFAALRVRAGQPAKAAARNAGADIIDLGMGNPDLPAPAHVIDKLKESLGKPRTDRYSSSRGIPALRKAQAAYYGRRFGVKLNPDTQVVATLGSKEGFANVAQAISAPGDVVLCPNPSYPIHAFGFLMAGGVIRSVPAEANDDFFPRARARRDPFDPEAARRRRLLPVEPDRACRDLDFYRDLVAFAKKHGLFILSDLAYAEVYFDDKSAAVGAAVHGAMDVTVEFTSMSKTFSMPGWRMGFAVGNERIIAALARVKSYLDYGAFTPIQAARSRR